MSRNFDLRTSDAHFIKKSAVRGTAATCDSLPATGANSGEILVPDNIWSDRYTQGGDTISSQTWGLCGENMEIEAGIRLWNVGTVSRGIWIYGAGTP